MIGLNASVGVEIIAVFSLMLRARKRIEDGWSVEKGSGDGGGLLPSHTSTDGKGEWPLRRDEGSSRGLGVGPGYVEEKEYYVSFSQSRRARPRVK